MLLGADLVEGSSEGASAWAGRLSSKIVQLRAKVKDYAEGRATLEELLEEAKVNLESEPTEDPKEITELLLDQIDQLRHAISTHQATVMSAGAYDANTMNIANKSLWSVLE
jgi:hypothetical protein